MLNYYKSMLRFCIVLVFLVSSVITGYSQEDDTGIHPGHLTFKYAKDSLYIVDSSYYHMGRAYNDQLMVDIWEGARYLNAKLYFDQFNTTDFHVEYNFNIDACIYRFVIQEDNIRVQSLCGIFQEEEIYLDRAIALNDSLIFYYNQGELSMSVNEEEVYTESTGIEELNYSRLLIGFVNGYGIEGRLKFNESLKAPDEPEINCTVCYLGGGTNNPVCLGDPCDPGLGHQQGGTYVLIDGNQCSCEPCHDQDGDTVCDEFDQWPGCDDRLIGMSCGPCHIYVCQRCDAIQDDGSNRKEVLTKSTSFCNACVPFNCPPTCDDMIQNQGETGVDCGGPNCDPCPPSCDDGIQNQGETEVDCGGPNCGSCPTCTDMVQNGDEEGVDCGGSDCPACPTCTDMVQNGDEEGVDCGGSDCDPCPTCTDMVQNGDEEGVDCGGSDCPACPTCTDGEQNGDEEGVDCGGSCDPCEDCIDGPEPGEPCNTEDCVLNQTIQDDCDCGGGTPAPDTDGDGLCDVVDPCPGIPDKMVGDTCDDGDACTEEDVIVMDNGQCLCRGTTPVEICNGLDDDCDGVVDNGLNCTTTEDCSDGVDNDGDTLVDCDDFDCEVFNLTSTTISPTCPGQNDGEISVSADGNNLVFRLGDSGSYGSSNTFQGLAPGSYIVHVRNNLSGCPGKTIPVVLPEPSCSEICNNNVDDDGDGDVDCDDDDCGASNLTRTITPPTCPDQDDGVITVSATGSNLVFKLGNNGTYSASNTFSGLSPGGYTVHVKSSSSTCPAKTISAVVPVPNCNEICDNGIDDDDDNLIDCEDDDCGAVNLTASPMNPTCPDLDDGMITASALGHNLVFSLGGGTYSASSTFTGLSAGNYTIHAKNSLSNCPTLTLTVVLEDPNCDNPEVCDNGMDDDGDMMIDCDDSDCGVTIGVASTLPTCPALDDGTITVSGTGNALEYSINGGTFSTSNVFTGLGLGSYTVIIRNGSSQCSDTKTVTFTDPDCDTSTCTDGILNGNETEIDCGGDCPDCPTCTDGIQNGDEEGIDCGGPECEDCPPPVCPLTLEDCDDQDPRTTDYITFDCMCGHFIDNCAAVVSCDDGNPNTSDGHTIHWPCECVHSCNLHPDDCWDPDPNVLVYLDREDCECKTCGLTPEICEDGNPFTYETVVYDAETCECDRFCTITWDDCPPRPNTTRTLNLTLCKCSYSCDLEAADCDDENEYTIDFFDKDNCKCDYECTLNVSECDDEDPYTNDTVTEDCKCKNICNRPATTCDDENPLTFDYVDFLTCECRNLCRVVNGMIKTEDGLIPFVCDDENPLTDDSFDEDICECVFECNRDPAVDCFDDNPNTLDILNSDCECENPCTLSLAACNDDNPDTEDSVDWDNCLCVNECLITIVDCDDLNDDTVDTLVDCVCHHDCLLMVADCVDGNPDTDDLLVDCKCENPCTLTPADCDDGDPNTIDFIQNCACVHDPICTKTVADCDDENPNTTDTLIIADCMCENPCNLTLADCDDEDEYTVDSITSDCYCSNICQRPVATCDDGDDYTIDIVTDDCECDWICTRTEESCNDDNPNTTDIVIQEPCGCDHICNITLLDCDDQNEDTLDELIDCTCKNTCTLDLALDCDDENPNTVDAIDLINCDCINDCQLVAADCVDDNPNTDDIFDETGCSCSNPCNLTLADCDDMDEYTVDTLVDCDCVNTCIRTVNDCDDDNPNTIDIVTLDPCGCDHNCTLVAADCDDENPDTDDTFDSINCSCTNQCRLVVGDCDDGDPCTTDILTSDCRCVSQPNEDLIALYGTSCDDGDPLTFDDTYQNDCTCRGLTCDQRRPQVNVFVSPSSCYTPGRIWFEMDPIVDVSIDGGVTYTADYDQEAAPGTYQVWIRWQNGLCSDYLADITVEEQNSCDLATLITAETCCGAMLTVVDHCSDYVTRWQVSEALSDDWSDLSGVTGDVLDVGTLGAPYTNSSGYQYRPVVTFSDVGLPTGAGCELVGTPFRPIYEVVAEVSDYCELSAEITGLDALLCTSPQVYQWQYKAPGDEVFVDIPDAHNDLHLATQDGDYRVIAYVGADGLSSADRCYRVSDELSVVSCTLTVDLGPDHIICEGSEVTLDPITTGQVSDYVWSTGAVSTTITVGSDIAAGATETYSVTVSDIWGRTATDDVCVTAVAAPTGSVMVTHAECGTLGEIDIEEDIYEHPLGGVVTYSIDNGATYGPRSEYMVEPGEYHIWIRWSDLPCERYLGSWAVLERSLCDQVGITIENDCCSVTASVGSTCAGHTIRWEARYTGTQEWMTVQSSGGDILDVQTLGTVYSHDPLWQYRAVVTLLPPAGTSIASCELTSGWVQLDYHGEITTDGCSLTAQLPVDILCDAEISDYEWQLRVPSRSDYRTLDEAAATITATKDGWYRAMIELDNGCARYTDSIYVQGCIECTEEGISVDLGADHYLCYGRETRVDLDPIITGPDNAILTWYKDADLSVIPVFPLYDDIQDAGGGTTGTNYAYQYILQVSDSTQQCTVSDTVMVYITAPLDLEVTVIQSSCGDIGLFAFESLGPLMQPEIEVSLDGGLTYTQDIFLMPEGVNSDSDDYQIYQSQLNPYVLAAPSTYDIWVRYANGGCSARIGYIKMEREDIDCDDTDCPYVSIDAVQTTDIPDCSDLSSGTITITASGTGVEAEDIRYSIDGELYGPESAFSDLLPGDYTAYAMYEPTGCIDSMDVEIGVPECLYCELIESVEITLDDISRIELDFNDLFDRGLINDEAYVGLIDDMEFARFVFDQEVPYFNNPQQDTVYVRLPLLKSQKRKYARSIYLDKPVSSSTYITRELMLKSDSIGIIAALEVCKEGEIIQPMECDFSLTTSTCRQNEDFSIVEVSIDANQPANYRVFIFDSVEKNKLLSQGSQTNTQRTYHVRSSDQPLLVQVFGPEGCVQEEALPPTSDSTVLVNLELDECLTLMDLNTEIGCNVVDDLSCLEWGTPMPDGLMITDDNCLVGTSSGTITIVYRVDGRVFTREIFVIVSDTDRDGRQNSEDPDVDGDGTPNGMDDDIDGDGVLNEDDDDMDGDGIPNIVDPVQDGTDTEICDEPGDDDGDGLADCDDPDCHPDPSNPLVVQVSVDHHSICDGETGQISVIVQGGDLSDYNICFGDRCIDPATGVLNGLGAGSYDPAVTTKLGCEVSFIISEEICGNDRDDDGDGYADCEDLDCILNTDSGIKSPDPVKSFDQCLVVGSALSAEILSLIANNNLRSSSLPGLGTDQLITRALATCGPGCTIEDFYTALSFDDIIIEDPSLTNCPLVKCVYDKLFENETKLFKETIKELYNDPNIITKIEIGATSGSGGTSYDPASGVITITLSPNLSCDDNDSSDPQNDLDIAGTLLHEGYHAEMFRELVNDGYDPNDLGTYQELWDNYYVNYYAKYQGIDALGNVQHAIMVYTDRFIERLARALHELNGDPNLTWQHFQRLAWEGLDYVSPTYNANRDYSEGGEIWQLHQELLDSNPTLTLGCDN